MKSSRIALIALLGALSCARAESRRSPDPSGVAYEVGASDFPFDDLIVIEEVHSSIGRIAPGAVLTVRGRYELRSRERASLYLGTTASTSEGASTTVDSRQRTEVALGGDEFELTYVVPGPGSPHVSFYDSFTGQPFGGIYFGQDETLQPEEPGSASLSRGDS